MDGPTTTLLVSASHSQMTVTDHSRRHLEDTTEAQLTRQGSLRKQTTNNEVRFGNAARNVSVFVNGSINATGNITQNSGFDVAEMFSAEEAMGSGDLVIATDEETVRKATKADAHLVIGAVSTQPGFILANPGLANPVLIGLAGRIPVKVTGDVQPGDFITISDTPGIGERATSAGFVIGRAIGSKRADNTVMIIIQPYYFNPAVGANGALVGAEASSAFFEDKTELGLAVKAGALENLGNGNAGNNPPVLIEE